MKRKAAEIKKSQQKTGGGIDEIELLTLEDENILQLMMRGNIVVIDDDNIKAGLPTVDEVSLINIYFCFKIIFFLNKTCFLFHN